MFGQPQWFRPKTYGSGLVPITWQGWLYTAGWMGTIAMPFLLLLDRHQPLEAWAWLTAALGALLYDVRQILRSYGTAPTAAINSAAAPSNDGVLYILDSRPGQPVATRNFQLQARG